MEPEVEDVVCRLPRLLKSTMIYTRPGLTYAFPGGVVLVGEVALRRAWSLDLSILLHSLLEWETIHPWNQQYR